jgi:predicted AlkP superfamily phosphohydrolase/phosphomutase
MGRVIGIGIDAGTIGLIDELVAAGSLPNLAALRARSIRTQLDGAPNHQFGVIWPQFIAGAEARLAGEWLRFSFDPAAYEGYQSGARHRIEGNPPFWELAQVRTVTLDVPSMTVSGPGVHVTAWGADAPLYPRASQPRGLLRELDARFGVHPAFETYDCGWHDPKRLDRMTDACVTGARRRAEVAVELMTRFDDWDLFLTVMSESHMASEIMWHATEPDHPLADFDPHARARLDRVFNAIDDAVGVIVARVPDDAAIVVFSLDGMRMSHGDVPSLVLLPELLHRRHFGTPKLRDIDAEAWRRAGCPPLVPRRGRPWRADMNERLVDPPPRPWTHRVPGYQAARLSRPGRRVLQQIKGMPIGALGIPVPPECMDDPATLDGLRDSADQFLFIGNYREHRSAMRAFALPTFGGAYVRINLAGRDAAGIVPVDEFDAECRAFESFIGECRDVRTGEPIAKRVLRLGDDDPLDPSGERYGDLFVEWMRPTDAIEHPDIGVVGPVPFNRTGAHSDRGFAWVSGNGIAPGDLPMQSVLDLPPTIVRLLSDDAELPPSGRPIPELAGIRDSR